LQHASAPAAKLPIEIDVGGLEMRTVGLNHFGPRIVARMRVL